MTFEDFQLEFDDVCGYDDVSMYEGSSSSSTLIRRVCGDTLPSPVQTESNMMFVQFLTDRDTGYYGFKAQIEFVNAPGKIVVKPTQIVAILTLRKFKSSKKIGKVETAAPIVVSKTLC